MCTLHGLWQGFERPSHRLHPPPLPLPLLLLLLLLLLLPLRLLLLQTHTHNRAESGRKNIHITTLALRAPPTFLAAAIVVIVRMGGL